MADIPLLWSPWARKEAFDVLVSVWASLDPPGRVRLGNLILEGPPDALLQRLQDPEERLKYSNRVIFDRIRLLERIGNPPIERNMEAFLAGLRGETPNMDIAEGERAHFSSYSESSGWSPRPQARVDARELTIEGWVEQLQQEKWELDSQLMAWRDLGRTEPSHVISLLRESLTGQHSLDQLWSYGLQGLREVMLDSIIRNEVLELLSDAPHSILNEPRVSSAAADLVDAISSLDDEDRFSQTFWRIFDKIMLAASQDADNSDEPGDNGWVSLAINRSLGRLATAFLNGLFARELVVGQGIPPDFLVRFDEVLSVNLRSHLPARIVVASRLSYLYAIDPSWASLHLLPAFSWATDIETIAAWAGYTNYPSIDPELWTALKPSFVLSLDASHLNLLDHETVRVMAQLLALVGIIYGLSAVPRQTAQAAIRAFPESVRTDMASWIADYIKKSSPDEVGPGTHDSDESPDQIWRNRIEPWMRAVWPSELTFQRSSVFKKFALAAIATNEAFPAAVDSISPYAVASQSTSILDRLASSSHPLRHPRASLKLLDLVLSKDGQIYELDRLRSLLDQLVEADQPITGLASYQAWRTYIELRGG